VLLSKPKLDKELDKADEGKYVAFGCCAMQGWRTGMEDAHAMVLRLEDKTPGAESRPPKSFFAVYDGHGGYEVARYAARHVHKILEESEKYQSGQIGDALVDAYKATDDLMLTTDGLKELQEIHDTFSLNSDTPFGVPDSSSQMIGCTAVSCVIDFEKRVITCANTGDSRCIVSEAGKFTRLSEDHKPQLESEERRILAAGGKVLNGRVNGNLNLTRTLGDHQYKRNKALKPEEQIITCVPDIKTYDIKDETDFLILGCDGIWDVMPDQEAVNFVLTHLLPRDCLTEEEKNLSTKSNIQTDPKFADLADSTANPEQWPGDNATSLDDLLCRVASQLVDKCCAPSTNAVIGCDNMSACIVLNREGTFGKRVVAALSERLAKQPPAPAAAAEEEQKPMEDGEEKKPEGEEKKEEEKKPEEGEAASQ